MRRIEFLIFLTWEGEEPASRAERYIACEICILASPHSDASATPCVQSGVKNYMVTMTYEEYSQGNLIYIFA